MAATHSSRMPPLVLPSDQDSSGRTLGAEELQMLEEVIRSGTLWSTRGMFVKRFEERFAAMLGVPHALACASGSAAIHTAIAAINPEPGEEIVTSPITDMGALTPILYQGAVPVFADVDPRTCNITAETIAPCLSERTRAIIVTHLFGNPCAMEPIMALAQSRGIPVIEDACQALGARAGGRPAGAIGTIGCFSFQQGKHITTGEGGMVVTSDRTRARRMFLFVNKSWGYGDEKPDHYFIALNYRLSELQGAVGLAQLTKLADVAARRIALADQFAKAMAGMDGLEIPFIYPGNVHSYWRYALRIDGARLPGGGTELARRLKERGIPAAPRYIQKPAFQCTIFQKQETLGNSRFPFTLARPEAVDYDPGRFPGTFAGLERVFVLPWNERYTDAHLDSIAAAIRECVNEQRKGDR